MSIFIEPDFTSSYEAYPLVLVDVGASGGLKRNWMEASRHLRLVGFDADERAPEGETHQGRSKVLLRVGLYKEKGSLTLYQTSKQRNSSILRPNPALVSRFALPERFDIVETKTIHVDTLDNQLREHGITDVDFIKVDTQGSELFILQGGAEVLRSSVFGVEVEVEFAELYEDQPFFADVDRFLRPFGFQLFDLKPTYWKRAAGHRWGKRKGQLICGDALYLKDPSSLRANIEGVPDEPRRAKVLKALSICFLYGYLDFALEIFEQERHLFDENQAAAILGKIRSSRSLSSRTPMFRGRQRLANLLSKLWEIVEPTYEYGMTGQRHLGNL